MGFEYTSVISLRSEQDARGCRGISLLLIVFLMTAVAVTAVGVLTFGVKLRSVAKERMVPERLDTIRRALQQYYLSHHDLPPSFNTPRPYTVPVDSLNLPQEYRFDLAGQFIRYDRFPFSTGAIDIQGLTVQGKTVAAVLVAPGPDKMIETSNSELNDTTYDQTGDDIVVAVSLRAEAIKIAGRAAAILQMAAKAYDGQYDSANYNAQFDNANNDGDYNYPANMIDPGPDGIIGTADDFHIIDPGPDNIFCTFDDIPTPPLINVGPDGLPDTADDTRACRVTISIANRIDEDGYVSASGGIGTNCVRYAQLTNDPDRGTASLDGCATALEDIIDVFGLSERYAVDPWGNAYRWGNAADYHALGHNISVAEDATRDRRYWTFFSMGPDEVADTDDDITPTTDRIDGYYTIEPPP